MKVMWWEDIPRPSSARTRRDRQASMFKKSPLVKKLVCARRDRKRAQQRRIKHATYTIEENELDEHPVAHKVDEWIMVEEAAPPPPTALGALIRAVRSFFRW